MIVLHAGALNGGLFLCGETPASANGSHSKRPGSRTRISHPRPYPFGAYVSKVAAALPKRLGNFPFCRVWKGLPRGVRGSVRGSPRLIRRVRHPVSWNLMGLAAGFAFLRETGCVVSHPGGALPARRESGRLRPGCATSPAEP